jgi:hypothetical protein
MPRGLEIQGNFGKDLPKNRQETGDMTDEAGKARPRTSILGVGVPQPRAATLEAPSLEAILNVDSFTVCTEKTGIVHSPRAEFRVSDGVRRLFVDGVEVDFGGRPQPIGVDWTRRGGHKTIYLPTREVLFGRGSDVPLSKRQFRATITRMIEDINSSMGGRFREVCRELFPSVYFKEPAVYIVGRTDRLDSEERNMELSKRRALRVAKALYERRDEIKRVLLPGGGEAEVGIFYAGIGESRTDTEDEVASPEDRAVELMVTSMGPPMKADWRDVSEPDGAPRGNGWHSGGVLALNQPGR